MMSNVCQIPVGVLSFLKVFFCMFVFVATAANVPANQTNPQILLSIALETFVLCLVGTLSISTHAYR